MDQSGANHSCYDKDVKDVDGNFEKNPASDKVHVETPDKTVSKGNFEVENILTSHKQQSGYFQKDSESCEIVANVWHSFSAFQRTIDDTQMKDNITNESFYDHISAGDRSANQWATDTFLPNTSESGLQVSAENYVMFSKPNEVTSPRELATTKSSTSISKNTLNSGNCSSFSNSGFQKRDIYYDIFKEDDDWDIYKPMIGAIKHTPAILSSPAFRSIETFLPESKECFSEINSMSSDRHNSCQRVSPFIASNKGYLASNSSSKDGDIFSEFNEKRILREVEEFFSNNPVQETTNLSSQESKKCIITAPYFSREFALTHGLSLPDTKPIQELNLTKDPSFIPRLLVAYEQINNSGISKEDLFHYIEMYNNRLTVTSPEECFRNCALDLHTIYRLDIIQERVGADVFHRLNELLRTGDAESQAIFQDRLLFKDMIQVWNENKTNLLREQNTSIKYDISTQNESHRSSDNELENVFVSGINPDSPNTTSPSHGINAPGLNASDSNPYSDDCDSLLQMTDKTSQLFLDLTKVISVKIDDILGSGSKMCPFISQSAKEREKLIQSSFDSFQSHIDKSDSSSTDSITIPHIQNSIEQNDEKSNKVHSVNSRNFSNNATHFASFVLQSSNQSNQETLRDFKSRKSNQIPKKVSTIQPGLRKHISQDKDEKSKKRIRLQENVNTGQQVSTKEESLIKNESRSHSKDCWIKPRTKSCIIM